MMGIERSFAFIAAAVLASAVALDAQGARGQGAAPAAAPPAAPARLSTDVHPDISGIWTRLDTAGSGSWGGISQTFAPAQLQPEFAAKLPPPQYSGVGPAPEGFVPPAYDIATQAPTAVRCAVGGGGFNAGGGGYNIDSSGMALMASNDEVLMLRDGAQGARRIRLDGRGFPDPTRMNGLFSIGRWEGDALVVTTRGFGSGMIQTGRGWTEPSTELTETFKLHPDGSRMTITYTFSDPRVYVKPHTYDMVFERMPPNQYIFESWCDSRQWIEEQRKTAKPAAPSPPTGGQ